MVPVTTPVGAFNVWTKRVGSSATTQLLLLHGGPGDTHEYFECFENWLPAAGVEFYYYDQLGSFYSDQPNDASLLTVERFVDEVEQVRQALGLEEFFLLGHSWGGVLAIEYALEHQKHLKGLVVSNMMASIPAYNAYAESVLMPRMDQAALVRIRELEAEGRTEEPEYEQLLLEHYYLDHVLRMPLADWPDPVLRSHRHLNRAVYVPMQGPSELGASGVLADWDRTADLARIDVPTLVIGAEHDTMDPAHLRWMADVLPQGSYLHCPEGSHTAMYDDERTYMEGLIAFLTRGRGSR
jgi:proline iminopeptidase